MVSGRGWIQGWMSCSEGCLASSLSYLLSWKPAVTIYLVVCLRVGPTRVRTKKVQKGTASACRFTQNERVCHTISGLKCGIRRTPPTFFRSPKKHVGGVYFTWSGEIFLRNFLPYPPPYSRVKGGDINTYIHNITLHYIHTYIHLLRNIFANSDVECILRAKTLQLNLTGAIEWSEVRNLRLKFGWHLTMQLNNNRKHSMTCPPAATWMRPGATLQVQKFASKLPSSWFP